MGRVLGLFDAGHPRAPGGKPFVSLLCHVLGYMIMQAFAHVLVDLATQSQFD